MCKNGPYHMLLGQMQDISEVIKYLRKGLLKAIKPSCFPVGLFEVCISPKNKSRCRTLLEDESLK